MEDFSWWRHEESYLNHFRPSETRKQARKLTLPLRLYLLSITNTLIYNIAQWAYVFSDQYVINWIQVGVYTIFALKRTLKIFFA